jgi:hypothetical protein
MVDEKEKNQGFVYNVLGHDADDQRRGVDAGKSDSLHILLTTINKFNGEGDAENWLKQIILKLDSLEISMDERNNLIPTLLTGDAIIWYVRHQHKMPTFVSFMQKFLYQYQRIVLFIMGKYL